MKMRGPGRPRKWEKPLRQWRSDIPEDDYEFIESTRTKLGLSRAEFLHMVLNQANIDLLELQAKIKHLEEALEKEQKEKQILLEERDKLLEKVEKLELQLEALKRGGKVTATRMTKVLNKLVEVLEEGKTFADTMVEIGIELPQEQREVLAKLFVTQDDEGKRPDVLKPLRNIRKLRGWVLVKAGSSDMLNYVWTREDTLKASKSVKTALPKPKEGQPAVEVPRAKVEASLKAWLNQYEQWASNWRTKGQAESFLKSVGNNGLRRLVREYGFDVVAEVVGSNADYRAVFGPFLLKFQEKKVEVKADVSVEACDI